jgi:hypothetical protein
MRCNLIVLFAVLAAAGFVNGGVEDEASVVKTALGSVEGSMLK